MEYFPLVRLSEFVRQSGLQITTGHLNRLIHAGVLPATRVGFHWHVDPNQALKVLVHRPAVRLAEGPGTRPDVALAANSDAEPQ
jgi:hypothetical protein